MATSVWLPATPRAIAWACLIIVGAIISRFFFFHTGVNSCILSVSFVTGQIFGTISMVVGLAAATNMLALSNSLQVHLAIRPGHLRHPRSYHYRGASAGGQLPL